MYLLLDCRIRIIEKLDSYRFFITYVYKLSAKRHDPRIFKDLSFLGLNRDICKIILLSAFLSGRRLQTPGRPTDPPHYHGKAIPLGHAKKDAIGVALTPQQNST